MTKMWNSIEKFFSRLPLLLACLIFIGSADFASCGLTSSFIRKEWPAKDIPLDNEVFSVPKGHNAPQQVYYCILHSYFMFQITNIPT